MSFVYTPAIPQLTDIPSQSAPLFAANYSYLQSWGNKDHNFSSNTANATDGYHKVIHNINQAGTYGDNTPAPIVGIGQLYTKTIAGSQQLFYHQGTGATANNEAALSVAPVRAAVLFDGTGAILNAGNAKFNVTSVTKTGFPTYIVNFTLALPSNFYFWQMTGFDNSGNPVIAAPRKSGTYGTFITTTSIEVQFLNQNGTNITGLTAGSVIIFGG